MDISFRITESKDIFPYSPDLKSLAKNSCPINDNNEKVLREAEIIVQLYLDTHHY